ncbi:cytochrome b [Pseudomonas sp. NPDC087804]|uniref:cytochrome b n=1 Tax=Pseudomonas sp. NPDC087804 TaxID=3364449 RepID=UPI003811E59A
MQIRDTGLGFSPITIILHWLTLIGLVALLVMEVEINDVRAPSMRFVELQNLIGLLIFLMAIYRLRARMQSYHPLPVGTPNPIEVIISRSVAFALVLATVLLPIAIWGGRAADGVPVYLPGGLTLPMVFSPNPTLKQVVDILFNIGSGAFLFGLALHMFGACKNHFVLKNDTLKRMLGKQVEL